MHRLKGTGLPNVFLLDGVTINQSGGRTTYAYADLDGLYSALTIAVALSPCAMTSAELRFVRKRLGMSQDELGALVEKRGQTVAKWEKDELPVPPSDSTVIKLVWLGKHAPRELRRLAVRTASGPRADAFDYVFSRASGRWAQDPIRGRILAAQRARMEAHQAIGNAVTSARVASAPITALALTSSATSDATIHSSLHTTT